MLEHQANVTGTAISASPINRPARIPRFAASNPGASAYARTSRNASSYGTRSGCATVPSSAPRRPRELRNTRGSTGPNPRAASRATERFGPSGCRPQPGRRDRRHRPRPSRQSHLQRDPATSEIPATSNSSGSCSRSAVASSTRRHGLPGQRRRSPEARHVHRHHIVSQQGQHGVPDAVVGAERMQQDERQERARINAVSTADPPATAAVLGAAPPGRPPRPIAVDTTSLTSPAIEARQQRLHRRVVQDRGDGQRRAARSRACRALAGPPATHRPAARARTW